VAVTLSNQATLHFAIGKLSSAARLHRQALAMKEKLLGPTHVDVALTLNNFAVLHRINGDREIAVGPYRRALPIFQGVLSPRYPKLVACRKYYARLLRDTR
jgi:hypothetical protein